MKRLFRNIIVLVCVATLCIMPASTVLAASNAVLITSTDTMKFYEYQPDQYSLAPGSTTFLADVQNGGYFSVPAGYSLSAFCNIDYSSTLYVEIFKLNYGLVYSGYETSSFFISLPATTSASGYIIRLTNSGSTTVKLDNYCFYYY